MLDLPTILDLPPAIHGALESVRRRFPGGRRATHARASGVTLVDRDGPPGARLRMDLIVDRQDSERRAAAATPTIRTVRGLTALTPSPILSTSSVVPARPAVSAPPMRSWRRAGARRKRDQTPAALPGPGTALPLAARDDVLDARGQRHDAR